MKMKKILFFLIVMLDVVIAIFALLISDNKGMETIEFSKHILLLNAFVCVASALFRNKTATLLFALNTLMAPLILLSFGLIYWNIINKKDFAQYSFQYKQDQYEVNIYYNSNEFLLCHTINEKISGGSIIKVNVDTLILVQEWKTEARNEWINKELFDNDSLYIYKDSLFGLTKYPITLNKL